VGVQPIIRTSAIARRLRNTVIAATLGAAVLLPAGLLAAPGVAAHVNSGGNDCSRWTSITKPPDYIRVYRHKSGRVVRVPFRRYVVTVIGKEWPSYLPQAVVEAGAVAAKQYAWYHVLHGPRHTRDGRCFDVRDGTRDQLYKPHRARVGADHYNAISATWNISLIREGRLFMTGYRRGNKGRCGRDANGWKLYARTAMRCAWRGKDYLQILRIYYGPNLTIRR
jgi:peptidoglycan hydrolase-like amidase